MAGSRDDAIINTIVGKGAFLRGDIELEGYLRVDGSMAGSIRTKGKVFVSEEGRCECSIRARAVVVGGIVKGDIRADENVTILRDGVVIGDIYAPLLNAEGDVTINGQFVVTGPAAAKA